MAIALESAGTVTTRSAETSTAVPMPATVTSGSSILVLFGACNSSAQITAASGWNTWELRSRAGSTSIPDIYIAWRLCDGTEGASVTVTHPNAVSIWQISSWSGVNTTTPLDVAVGENDSTATTNATAPTITPVTANVALLHFSTNNTNTATSTPPSAPAAFTEICDGTGASRSGAVSYLLNQPASATGSVTATWSVTGSGMAFLVALRPAGATTWNADAAQTVTATQAADVTATHPVDAAQAATASQAATVNVVHPVAAAQTVTATQAAALAAVHPVDAVQSVTATQAAALNATHPINAPQTVTATQVAALTVTAASATPGSMTSGTVPGGMTSSRADVTMTSAAGPTPTMTSSGG